MKSNTKFSLIFWGGVVAIILIFLSTSVKAQKKVKVLSPSISFMDANVDKGGIDHELALLFYDDGVQRFYMEWEQENRRKYRRIDVTFVFRELYYFEIFQKTAKRINNVDVGFFKKLRWFAFGSSVHRDATGNVSILANIKTNLKYVNFKYQRGIKKWVVDGSLNWSKPIRDKLFTFKGFDFVPVFSILLRYYEDGNNQGGGRRFRQIKFSIATEWRK